MVTSAGSSAPPNTERPQPGGVESTASGAGDDDANEVFGQEHIETFSVNVDPEMLARIDQRPSGEERIPATLEYKGRSYGPIAFRYKGSAGAFLAPCTAATTPGLS
ncbi:MAG: hypothetical protein ABW321_19050, partial [Polyangiales bacterium]